MMRDALSTRIVPVSQPSDLPRCVEQLRDQLHELSRHRFALPERLLITCGEPEAEHLAVKLAPALRVRLPCLRLDAEVREMLEFAVHGIGVRLVAVIAHTGCDHFGTSGDHVHERIGPHWHGVLGVHERMSAAASRAGQRFADARDGLSRFCRELATDPLLRTDRQHAACIGVLHVQESGTTHLLDPDLDRMIVLD